MTGFRIRDTRFLIVGLVALGLVASCSTGPSEQPGPEIDGSDREYDDGTAGDDAAQADGTDREAGEEDAGDDDVVQADESDGDAEGLTVGDSYTRGAEDPDLRIYEFSSFQCPFCARAQSTIDTVLDEYDNVQLVYKNFPLPHQEQSEPAARAALAAGEQGEFWAMHEALFDNQDRFGEDGLWEDLARDIGLDVEQFREDFNSDEIARRVKEERQLGESRGAGGRGVPAFVIGDGEINGAQPIDKFREVIDRQLEE